ncbi:MAG: lipoate--protein ligase family protein [Thermoproteota archaeon]|nr:lipoate--protein ligase family protein [Thermoproteota archaeon]
MKKENLENKIKILISNTFDPKFNLALEEAILNYVNEGKEINVLRLWINKKSAILAFHEKVFDVIDVDYCIANDIEINRRITGGGAVYHDEGNLNWSFFFNRTLFKKLNLLEIYKYFSEIIISALENLGINTRFYEPNWLGIDGKKISGMAGYIKNNSLLIHGTLLINANMENLRRVCKLHYKYPPTVNISDFKKVEIKDVIREIVEEAKQRFDVMEINDKLNENILKETIDLEKNKYSTLSWIFKE